MTAQTSTSISKSELNATSTSVNDTTEQAYQGIMSQVVTKENQSQDPNFEATATARATNVKNTEVTTTSDTAQRQKVLITGCSTGIGKATALRLAAQGWQVIATIRSETGKEELEQAGVQVKYCDVDDADSVANLFSDPDVQDIDAAYLNAGYGYVTAIEDIDRDAFQKQLSTNVIGFADCLVRAMAIFRRRGHGKLVACSSIIGFAPLAFRGAYGASKAAVEALVQTARIENQNKNIHLSLLCPGPVASNFRKTALKSYNEATVSKMEQTAYATEYKEQEKRMQNNSAGKRFTATPEQVAKLVEKILTTRKPKTRYFICLPVYLVWYGKKFLPTSWFEKIMSIAYKLEK